MFKIIDMDITLFDEQIDYIIDYGRGRQVALMQKDLYADRYITGYLLTGSTLMPFKNLRREFLPIFSRTKIKAGNQEKFCVYVVGFTEDDDFYEEE